MSTLYELTDIEFAYNGEPVLSFPSLTISRTGITALAGPNGSGKTTLLNILAFIQAPRRGHIRFLDKTVVPADYGRLRRRVGYVQQKPYLFHTSVRRNIEAGLKIRGTGKKERRELSRRIIDEFGLGVLADRNARELSGGEAQKVAIARAMILQPEVLILDEPFGHLDRSFRRELEQMLTAINERSEAAVIFTTHDQMQARSLAEHTIGLFSGHPVPVTAVNLFSGICHDNVFDTGSISIRLPDNTARGHRLAVDSEHLVISKRELDSSMRNRFCGRVSSLSENSGLIHVVIEAGETFHAAITPAALRELDLGIGDEVWVSFKSSAVHVF